MSQESTLFLFISWK